MPVYGAPQENQSAKHPDAETLKDALWSSQNRFVNAKGEFGNTILRHEGSFRARALQSALSSQINRGTLDIELEAGQLLKNYGT